MKIEPKYKHLDNVEIKLKGTFEGEPVEVTKKLIVKTIDVVGVPENYNTNYYYRYYLVSDVYYDQNGRWVAESEIIKNEKVK
jgi:hypothetical protein